MIVFILSLVTDMAAGGEGKGLCSFCRWLQIWLLAAKGKGGVPSVVGYRYGCWRRRERVVFILSLVTDMAAGGEGKGWCSFCRWLQIWLLAAKGKDGVRSVVGYRYGCWRRRERMVFILSLVTDMAAGGEGKGSGDLWYVLSQELDCVDGAHLY